MELSVCLMVVAWWVSFLVLTDCLRDTDEQGERVSERASCPHVAGRQAGSRTRPRQRVFRTSSIRQQQVVVATKSKPVEGCWGLTGAPPTRVRFLSSRVEPLPTSKWLALLAAVMVTLEAAVIFPGSKPVEMHNMTQP